MEIAQNEKTLCLYDYKGFTCKLLDWKSGEQGPGPTTALMCVNLICKLEKMALSSVLSYIDFKVCRTKILTYYLSVECLTSGPLNGSVMQIINKNRS